MFLAHVLENCLKGAYVAEQLSAGLGNYTVGLIVRVRPFSGFISNKFNLSLYGLKQIC